MNSMIYCREGDTIMGAAFLSVIAVVEEEVVCLVYIKFAFKKCTPAGIDTQSTSDE